MRKNNFNTNANGPDIELVCNYDTDLSRMEFEENFKILQHSGYRTFTKVYYIDCGNVPDDDGITFTIKGKVKDLKAFAKIECYWLENSELRKMTKDQVIDEILEFLARDRKITVLNYEEMNLEFFAKLPIEIIPSKTLVSVSISGYSQGDYAEVFYCPDDLEKCWGNAPDEKILKKTFARLFYDAPIWACFTINEEDYRYDELMDDAYEWEKEKFAAIVSEKSGIDRAVLLNFLPNHPNYN